MPERKPTKRESVGSAAAMNSPHLSWLPAPSKEKMTNCGAFSPGLSLVIGTFEAGQPAGRSPATSAVVFGGADEVGGLLELGGAADVGAGEDGGAVLGATLELGAADDVDAADDVATVDVTTTTRSSSAAAVVCWLR